MDVYKLAYTYTMSERKKTEHTVNPKIEMERTTIYSDYNNEVLARFKPEPVGKHSGLIEKMEKDITDYHFNYKPQIPDKSSK